jgi:ATP synthase protein I
VKDNRGSTYKAFSQAFSLATGMAAAIVIGYLLGSYLDRRFHTGPWLTVVFFLFGVGAGFKMMYESLMGKDGDKGDN